MKSTKILIEAEIVENSNTDYYELRTANGKLIVFWYFDINTKEWKLFNLYNCIKIENFATENEARNFALNHLKASLPQDHKYDINKVVDLILELGWHKTSHSDSTILVFQKEGFNDDFGKSISLVLPKQNDHFLQNASINAALRQISDFENISLKDVERKII